MCGDVREELFSAGRRFWCANGKTAPNMAEEWSLSRWAMDEASVPVRVVDLPLWFQSDPQVVRDLLTEVRTDAGDAGTAASRLPGISGIEIDHDTYEVGDNAIRWRMDPGGERLCARVLLARLEPERLGSPGFQCYLLRLNWSLRFTSLTCCDEGVAVCTVLPTADERWHSLAANALAAVVRHLQPQISWWSSPAELLSDLFESVGIGVVSSQRRRLS
jgi:hypothetical protein